MRIDRAALAVLMVSVAVLLAGIVLAVRALMGYELPSVELPGPARELAARIGIEPPPSPDLPKRQYPAVAAPAGPHVASLPPNAGWTYDVHFGPAWAKAGQLLYRTQAGRPLGATMSWIPTGGQASTWFLGMLERDHPSHANTRFPGFFMHPVYFPPTLDPGAQLTWQFPWQQANGAVRRYDMTVAGWETVRVPAGEITAARLDGTLSYVHGTTGAQVRYSLWYAPQARQVIRVRWAGQAPDEGAHEMIAELASHTPF